MKNSESNNRSLLLFWEKVRLAFVRDADEGKLIAPNAPHPLPLPEQERGNAKRVLFLSLSGIGNLIMQLPAIKAVKSAHPDWHITVCVAPRGTKSIAQAQRYIDEVIEVVVSPPYQGGVRGGGALVQHIKNIFRLRKNNFDIAIVLSPGQLLKSALYLFLSGIPVRIGHLYPLKSNQRTRNFLTHAIDEKSDMHDVEQNLALVELVVDKVKLFEKYSYTIPEKNSAEAEQVLATITYNLEPKACFVGLHAGCAKGFEWKRWPLERFAETAKLILQKNPNVRFLVFGGPDEEEQKAELVKMISGAHPALAIPISASLLTTSAIMKHCRLFISNDSGLMHIASAVGIPTIGLFGPTDERQTGPRGPQSMVVRASGTKPVYHTESAYNLGNSSHATMLEITPQLVLDNIPINVL